MKHFKLILPIILILFSCTNDSVQTPENTQLEITVLDEDNLPIENSEVKLFLNQQDSDNNTNIIQTLTSDANGKVTFNNLQSISYFVKANKTCYLNGILNTIPLTNNTLNQYSVNAIDNFIGNIRVVNNSADEYIFSITSGSTSTTSTFNLQSDDQLTLGNWVAENYTYSYTQVGGTATTTSSLAVECGGTSNIVIN